MKHMNRNKTYIPFLLLVVVAGLALGSCSKSFVDKSPAGNLSTSEALSTPQLLQTDLIGLYSELRNVDQYGRDFPVVGDLMADNTFLEARNTGRYVYQFAYTVPTIDAVTLGMWQDAIQADLASDAAAKAYAAAVNPASVVNPAASAARHARP